MSHSERKKTIRLAITFSVLVILVAWVAPLLGGNPSEPGLGFFLWAAAPLLVSVLMRGVTHDWSDLRIKPDIRKNARWYMLSISAYPITMVLAAYAGVLTLASSFSEFSLERFLQIMLASLPFFLIFAVFEEVGWRGYLAPKLVSLGVNRYLAAALVALVWASWHLPYIRELTWDYSSENLVTFVPRFYLAMFAFSIVYGEITSKTATFWPAVLMHAMGNAFGHPLARELVIVAPGKEFLGSVGNGLFVILFMILLGAAINRWRMLQAPPSKTG